jgi:uncharacterized protein (UPF0147 family)
MTKQEIIKVLQENMEDTIVPEQLRQWAEQNQGKMLTVRNAPEGFRIVKQYGMTMLKHGDDDYYIAHHIVNVAIPCPDKFMDLNASHYIGAQERNAKRLALINDDSKLDELSKTITNLVDSISKADDMFGLGGDVVDIRDMLQLAFPTMPYIVQSLSRLGN